jgi:hypothetical protein
MEQIYLRWYARYDNLGCKYHHTGLWLTGGGGCEAGKKPLGTSFLIEVCPRIHDYENLDFNVYWKDMSCTGGCWGDGMINDMTFSVLPPRWLCIEILVKVNNPVSSYNGELAMWVDGVQKVYRKNLQLRITTACLIDNVAFHNYKNTEQFGTCMGSFWLDDVVIAKKYIGPINQGAPKVQERLVTVRAAANSRAHTLLGPRPNFLIQFQGANDLGLRVFDAKGREIVQHQGKPGQSIRILQ